MAWIYLAESEASLSLLASGSDLLPTARTIDTPKVFFCPRCSGAHFREPRYGMTCEHSTATSWERNRTSFTEDFLARTSALRDLAAAWTELEAVYTGKFTDLSENANLRSSFSKTCPRSEPAGLETWSGHLPPSGMTVDGRLFQPEKLAPRTYGKDGSYLPSVPTPRPCSGLRSSGANRTEILNALKLWPTPRASDVKGEGAGAALRRIANGMGCTLAGAVKLWPTPTVRDSNSIAKCKRGANASPGGTPLPVAVGGTLNPMWVEWLMGYPLGWTDLEGSVMPWFRYKRKSRFKG